jgi:deazaflavin-dependent oxidoreductase (nitroreductase family)
MPDWDPAEFTRALIADMRAHGGRAASGPMAGKPLMVLTTTGARTGEPRTSIVTYHKDGDRFAIAASMGGAPKHPAWYHNLVANPEATIEVDNETFKVRATDTSGAERDRLWDEHVVLLPEFGEYPKKTDRTIPMLLLNRTA